METSNGHGPTTAGVWATATATPATGVPPHPYLLARGFTAEVIAAAGWRVEALGERRQRYGLMDATAADVEAWFIPYRHRNGQVAFERVRIVDPVDLERLGGGKYRQPKGRQLSLYDPFGALGVDEPVDALLLVEGEANAATLAMLELGSLRSGSPAKVSLAPRWPSSSDTFHSSSCGSTSTTPAPRVTPNGSPRHSAAPESTTSTSSGTPAASMPMTL